MDTEHQVPIWFFVGGTLLIYGVIIFCTGLYEWVVPAAEPAMAMNYLHPSVWWGGVMAIVGALYVVRFWPWRKRDD
jgi:hypothetical protein